MENCEYVVQNLVGNHYQTSDTVKLAQIIHPSDVAELESSAVRMLLGAGSRLLDVRYEEEHEDICIPGSVLIPLHDLHLQIENLDSSTHWIVYCRSGKRSVEAALLLNQSGYQAVSLKGGINDWPYETAPGMQPISIAVQ